MSYKNRTARFAIYKEFEKEFLKILVTTWLCCRLEVMGSSVINRSIHYGTNLAFSLLGMIDYQCEMELYTKEILDKLRD